jgi:hypothetical protein
LHHIDVFDDYLAMVGDTDDYTLTGFNSLFPYVAIQSISRVGKIYWAKAINTYNPFYGA